MTVISGVYFRARCLSNNSSEVGFNNAEVVPGIAYFVLVVRFSRKELTSNFAHSHFLMKSLLNLVHSCCIKLEIGHKEHSD